MGIESAAVMAENIRKRVDDLAKEIASRAIKDSAAAPSRTAPWSRIIEGHARAVLLDWLLGDSKQ